MIQVIKFTKPAQFVKKKSPKKTVKFETQPVTISKTPKLNKTKVKSSPSASRLSRINETLINNNFAISNRYIYSIDGIEYIIAFKFIDSFFNKYIIYVPEDNKIKLRNYNPDTDIHVTHEYISAINPELSPEYKQIGDIVAQLNINGFCYAVERYKFSKESIKDPTFDNIEKEIIIIGKEYTASLSFKETDDKFISDLSNYTDPEYSELFYKYKNSETYFICLHGRLEDKLIHSLPYLNLYLISNRGKDIKLMLDGANNILLKNSQKITSSLAFINKYNKIIEELMSRNNTITQEDFITINKLGELFNEINGTINEIDFLLRSDSKLNKVLDIINKKSTKYKK